MIDPETAPIDVDELREWLTHYKTSHNLSWPRMATLLRIARGTISSWVNPTFRGDAIKIAREVLKFRQTVESQQEFQSGRLGEPDYVETRSSERIRALMVEAQAGNITLVATGPGTSKTATARYYASRISNVWLITCSPSRKTVTSLLAEVLRVVSNGRQGGSTWARSMEADIISYIRGTRGLLLVDEANHLQLDTIEQLRSLHDETGIGLCLMGNEELVRTIMSSKQADPLARLASRISGQHEQRQPLPEDIEAYLDAWGIEDGPQRDLLVKAGTAPRSGGLREVRQIILAASQLAQLDERPIALGDLRDVRDSRKTMFGGAL